MKEQSKITERLKPIVSSLASIFNEGEITSYILFTQGKDGGTHRFGAGCKYAMIGALRIIEHDILLEHSKNSENPS
jgi:hypothetical protein